MGNDHEIKFHEIKSGFFQVIKRTIMRSKVLFWGRLKVSIIFDNFVQEVNISIRRSKVIINFRPPEPMSVFTAAKTLK